jgi:DNA-binding XRE family transcriptional regulator
MNLVRKRLLIGTQQKVADQLGIHRVTVAVYEREGTEVPAWYEAALDGLRVRQGL